MRFLNFSILSHLSQEGESALVPNLMKGIFDLQGLIMNTIVYPVFTLLFFLVLIGVIVLLIYTIKKYREMDLMTSLKLFSASIILALINIDIYLIAFGKNAVLFLYLNVQKDIIFISIAFFIGFICGKLLLNEKKKREVIP